MSEDVADAQQRYEESLAEAAYERYLDELDERDALAEGRVPVDLAHEADDRDADRMVAEDAEYERRTDAEPWRDLATGRMRYGMTRGAEA